MMMPSFAIDLPAQYGDNHRYFLLSTTRMPQLSTIQFTPEQARALTGLTTETLRHWRRVVPYLGSRSGKAARYAFTDVVGLAVAKMLVDEFGLQIATMQGGIDALFRLLTTAQPSTLEDTIVCLTPNDCVSIDRALSTTRQAVGRSCVCVPLAPIVATIQAGVLPPSALNTQVGLPFPPEIVRSRA